MVVTVLRAAAYKSNAELMAAAHELNYIKDLDVTLDLTYGAGVFWKAFRPLFLATNSIDPDDDTTFHFDFRRFPVRLREAFDVVVFDGPYKLNGTPSAPDVRYGVGVKSTWQDRHALIRQGIRSSTRLVPKGGFVLVKCMDQVSSGAVHWQTREFADYGESQGLVLHDQLHMLRRPRVQPHKHQVHALANYSTLLCFKKAKSK